MPTMRYLAKKMLDDQSREPGLYPMIFKNDWKRIQFVIALRYEVWKRKVKAKCHL